MFPPMSLLCIYLIIMLVNVEAVEDVLESQLSKFRIGVTVDYTSRVGKEQMTAVKMAIDDYYKYTTNKPSLHIKHCGQDPASTIFSVMDLINKTQVNVILSLSMQNKLEFIAEICSKAQIPILSLQDATPVWVSKRWPFLIQATHKDYRQMKAVAAIVGSWQWRIVNVIYEDNVSARLSIFPHLVDALNKVGARIENFLALPLFGFNVSEQLLHLVHKQSRVFIVHTSLPLANLLFKEAKKLGLMEKDSVWIITNTISDLLDVLDTPVINRMQGTIGVKTYFPKNGTRIEYFRSTFRSRFHLEYPEEQYLDPSIHALQAYDAVWAVIHARERRGWSTIVDESSELPNGKTLLSNLYLGRFEGLTGEFQFINGVLASSTRFEVINLVGNMYTELGIWSVNVSGGASMSMDILREVVWPGGTLSSPRGWALPTSENPLLIGVPDHPPSYLFAYVTYNPGGEPSSHGLAIDVFNAVAQNLSYHLEYKFIPFNGSYDALVERVYNKDGVKSVDAVVGDTAILSSRSKYTEFSLPWADSGLQMVTLRKSLKVNTALLFSKPYTKGMWGLTAVITVYNGLAVWLMESTNHQEFTGSSWNNMGALIWLAFSTFFSLQGDRLHNNLSRVTIMVWLFVSIIIVQSYTAKLTSILTLPHFQHKYITVESLKMENAKVGCDDRSFVINYLETVLGFKSKNIKTFSFHDDYIRALKSKEIKVAFLEVPYVKVLRKKYCNSLEVVGETFNVGGFGFVFPVGSPMLPDINQAILSVKECGKLRIIEDSLVESSNCSDSKTGNDNDGNSLDVTSFWVLFLITGATSTIAVILHFLLSKNPHRLSAHADGTQGGQNMPGTIELVEHGQNETSVHVSIQQDPSLQGSVGEGEQTDLGEQIPHDQEFANADEQTDNGSEIANDDEQTVSEEQIGHVQVLGDD